MNRPPLFVMAALAMFSSMTQAHDGHGLVGAHWHASDAWGFVVVGVLLAAALWARRK